MRICIPVRFTENTNTISGDSPLAPHFGLADRFAVVDGDSGEILDECGVVGHCPGACHCPLPDLATSKVEALAGQAMGFRLMQISRRAGLPVLAVRARTLGELCHELRNQSPIRSLPSAICLTNARCQIVSGGN